MLIAFTGYKRSGKDTCANHLVTQYGFKKLAFATPIRDVAKVIYNLPDDFDWDIDKESPCEELGGQSRRYVMCSIGEGLKPTLGRNIWIRAVDPRLHISSEIFETENYVMSDLRLPEELQYIQKNNGIIVYLQRTKTISSSLTDHVSESYYGLMHANSTVAIFTNDKAEKLRQLDALIRDLDIAPKDQT